MVAVLSLDAADTTGEHAAHSSFASNGEIHKIRLSAEGQRIGLGEYIPPQRYGFMLSRPRQVPESLHPNCAQNSSAAFGVTAVFFPLFPSWHCLDKQQCSLQVDLVLGHLSVISADRCA